MYRQRETWRERQYDVGVLLSNSHIVCFPHRHNGSVELKNIKCTVFPNPGEVVWRRRACREKQWTADVVKQNMCYLCRNKRQSSIMDGLCGAWGRVDAVKLVVWNMTTAVSSSITLAPSPSSITWFLPPPFLSLTLPIAPISVFVGQHWLVSSTETCTF